MPSEHSETPEHTPGPSYEHILVPTDGSDLSRQAMEHAISLAVAYDGKIHALSIDEGGGSTRRDQSRTDSEDLAAEAVEEARERANARGVPITVSVRTGSSEEEIRQYAENSDVDIVVMGTEGRTGLWGAIFTSVAEKTVRDSPVPVLTVGYEYES